MEVGLGIVWKKYQIFFRTSKLFLEQLKKEVEI